VITRRQVLTTAGTGLIALPRVGRAAGEPVADTTGGRLRGVRGNGIVSFKGVRYGESTGGASRFLPPVPVVARAGILDADRFGASAPQAVSPQRPLDAWYGTLQPINEDCLFLNVYTPAIGHGRRPVMVWLHGGGWTTCAGTAPGFDGTHLARSGDVVVVTINHRLNVFGYLNLGDADPRFADAGAAGVLDMVAALRWVHANISAFGGDPGNVTIFGQSGGAAKVTALMGLPAAHGLFHKAIAQSCSGGLRLDGLEESARQAKALAGALGVEASGAALQGVPMDKLTAATRSVASPFRPVLDGRNFPQNPFDPAAPATAPDVPLMIGNAATEVTLFLANAGMANFVLEEADVETRVGRFLGVDPARSKQVIEAYRTAHRGVTPSEVLAAVATDYMYRRNTMRVAALQAAQAKAPVFAYVFDWKTPVLGGVLQSPHTLEVPFAFGTTDAAVELVGTGPEIPRLVRQTMARWVSFARHGVPSAPGGVTWPAYDGTHRATMMLDVESRVASNPGGEARQTLDDLPYFEYSRPASFVHA
jgi:para-nitrobenzyl esterase